LISISQRHENLLRVEKEFKELARVLKPLAKSTAKDQGMVAVDLNHCVASPTSW
jgi:t-SNARE complex subunit (syntaxin)